MDPRHLVVYVAQDCTSERFLSFGRVANSARLFITSHFFSDHEAPSLARGLLSSYRLSLQRPTPLLKSESRYENSGTRHACSMGETHQNIRLQFLLIFVVIFFKELKTPPNQPTQKNKSHVVYFDNFVLMTITMRWTTRDTY